MKSILIMRRLVSPAVIFISLLLASWYTQEMHRYVHVLFPILLFLTLLALLRSWYALGVTQAIILLFHAINQKKIKATAEPLLAIDLTQVGQATALTSYIDWWLVAGVGAVVLTLFIGIVWGRQRLKWYWRLMLLSPAIFSILLQSGMLPSNAARLTKENLREQLGLYHVIWDMPGNLNLNGLLGHLWFTAEIAPVPKRNGQPIPFYQLASERSEQQSSALGSASSQKPLDVFLILCEACWAQPEQMAASPLGKLLQRGFAATEIYSPVFGGATANAEFEMLTGLPIGGLRGVVYINYANAMRDKVGSLAQEAKAEGFGTHAMHNFTQTFWKRNVVYPKFGFDDLVFIDKMPWNGIRWPEDKLLLNAAWESVRQPSDKSRFYFLITVHTHGSYNESEKNGYGDYQRRLDHTMNNLAQFVDGVYRHAEQQQRRVLFVLFGDHKPSLQKWFYDNQVFNKSVFRTTGIETDQFRFVEEFNVEQRKQVFGVPLLLGSNDPKIDVQMLAKRLQHRAFYCVTPEIASVMLKRPSKFFVAAEKFCNSEQAQHMLFGQALFEENLYSGQVYADRLFAH